MRTLPPPTVLLVALLLVTPAVSAGQAHVDREEGTASASFGSRSAPGSVRAEMDSDGHFTLQVKIWSPGQVVAVACETTGTLSVLEEDCQEIAGLWNEVGTFAVDVRERTTLLSLIRGFVGAFFNLLGDSVASKEASRETSAHFQSSDAAFPQAAQDAEPEEDEAEYILIQLDFDVGGEAKPSWAGVCMNNGNPCARIEDVPTQPMHKLVPYDLLSLMLAEVDPEDPPTSADLLVLAVNLAFGTGNAGGDGLYVPDENDVPEEKPKATVVWEKAPEERVDDYEPPAYDPDAPDAPSTTAPTAPEAPRLQAPSTPTVNTPDLGEVLQGRATAAVSAADGVAETAIHENPAAPSNWNPTEGADGYVLVTGNHDPETAAQEASLEDTADKITFTRLDAEAGASGGIPNADARANSPTAAAVFEAKAASSAHASPESGTFAVVGSDDGSKTPRKSWLAFLFPPPASTEPEDTSSGSTGSTGLAPESDPSSRPGLHQGAGATGGGGAAIAVAALTGLTLLAGALALYSRLSRRGVGEQETRESILREVHANPGLTPQEIAERLGTHHTTIRYHLRFLEREKFVVARQKQRRIHYFLPGTADTRELETASVLSAEPARRIREAALAKPGMTIRDATEAAGVDRVTVHYHVKKLHKAGLLHLEKVGRSYRIFASEPAGEPAPPPTTALPLANRSAVGSRWH